MPSTEVTVGLCTQNLAVRGEWREFIDTKTFGTVTIAAPTWLDMVSHPLFPPDIAVLSAGNCSLRGLASQVHACHHLGVIVVVADFEHRVDAELARQLGVLFIVHDDSEAEELLAAVRAYREARATGRPISMNPTTS